MGYLLGGVSGVVTLLLASVLVSVDGNLSPLLVVLWSLCPFAVLVALYRTSPTAEQRVMFFAGAMAVLMASLGLLADCMLAGIPEFLAPQIPLLPRHLLVALVAFRLVAWMVDQYYRRTPHQNGAIGWGVDPEDGLKR